MEEIPRIRQQFQNGLWPKFLNRITINGLRGWSGQTVHFKFPISVIVGENGTGKSTILKASACAYQSDYYASTFFVNTHWDSVQGVDLNYTIKQGNSEKTYSLRKPTERWRGRDDLAERNVYWFDISRTLPLDATVGYAKVAKLAAGETSTESLSRDFRKNLSYILGKDYLDARFASPDINSDRHVGILERNFGEVSQFHQGAGEGATLDLFRSLEGIPSHSLLIIDEVEASLHPKAQRRLVRFLLWLSRTKRLQVLLSTHSQYVLEELPTDSRILLIPGATGPSVIYGASPEFALSKIDDEVHPECFLFVEDKEAKILLREIIARSAEAETILGKIGIFPVGPANVVKMLGELAFNEKLPYKGMGILDGDVDASVGCISLPGDSSPEQVVFADLKDQNWGSLSDRFGIGAGELYAYLEDAMLEPDPHRWTEFVGNRVLKSKHTVWEILAEEWSRICLADEIRDQTVNEIKNLL